MSARHTCVLRWVSLALAVAAAGCTRDPGGSGRPQTIRETGYLSCSVDSASCGTDLRCEDTAGQVTCVAAPAACAEATPTCACAAEALCGDAACRDFEGGITCGSDASDAAPAEDMGPRPNLDQGEPPPDPPFPSTLTYTPTGGDLRLSPAEGMPFPNSVDLHFVYQLDGRPTPFPGLTVELLIETTDATDAWVEQLGDPDADGVVTARLHAGILPGTLVVHASLSSADGPPDASSETYEVVGLPPSQVALRCDPGAVPAFDRRVGPMSIDSVVTTTCTATVLDRVGQPIEGVRVGFATEAGSIVGQGVTDPDGHAFSRLTPVGQAPVELVDSDENEPGDGQVRVMAWAAGAEMFMDVDGDGRFSAEIDFLRVEHDLADPFIDADDDGQYDEGEPFRDETGDALWDFGNGLWDSHWPIWSDATVLFVGRASPERSHVGFTCGDGCATAAPLRPDCPAADFYLAPGGALTFESLIADDNGNCLGGATDVITLVTTSPEVSTAQDSLPLSDTCRAPDGTLGAQPVTQVVTNLAVAAPLTAELFRVTVTASTLGADGRTYDEIREFTGCR